MADDPVGWLLDVLAFQSTSCTTSGSPLYGRILEGVADDVRAGGVSADLLLDDPGEPLGSALALRFLGAVHRIVLEERAPRLAAFYPSVGGSDGGDPVPAFVETVRQHHDELRRRIEDGVQTNEVGRSAVLVGGYASVAERTSLPLRVLELGASAGLNLRWDAYAYDTGRVVAGDPDSPVRFERVWEGTPPDLPARIEVASRRGCDRSPIDPTSDDGRLRLMSYVWPDQALRLQRLAAAIEIARRVPAEVVRADADRFVAQELGQPVEGVATVVAHSIVAQYLDAAARERLTDTIEAAGRRASDRAPLAWLRMEPSTKERAELRLTTWPEGQDRPLATCGYHGSPIWWEDAG
jgi:hypothetical protein